MAFECKHSRQELYGGIRERIMSQKNIYDSLPFLTNRPSSSSFSSNCSSSDTHCFSSNLNNNNMNESTTNIIMNNTNGVSLDDISDNLSSFSIPTCSQPFCEEEDLNEISYMDELFNHFDQDWNNFTQENDSYFQANYKFNLERLNVFKNILRAFKNYMKTKGDSVVIECMDSLQKPINIIKKQFNFFSKRHAPNSRLLSLLFSYDRYGRQFEYFLNHYSLEWLSSSKVKDLTQHVMTIFYLCRCFKNEELQQNIKVNKK